MFSRLHALRSQRLYSVKVKKTPTFRDLFHTPVFKTLFLTLVFGSVVVECTKNRKDIEGLQAAYGAKNKVLREVTQKVRNKEAVDVALEVNVANSMTRNKYNSVTDVQLDQSLDSFLKMADEDLDLAFQAGEHAHVPEPLQATTLERRNTSKFL